MPTFGLAQLDLLAQTSTVEHTAVKQDLSHHSVSEDKDPQTPQSACVRSFPVEGDFELVLIQV